MLDGDEQRLISDARNGSRDAFRLLVDRYMRQAYDIAYGVVGDHDDAEDVAQEAFVRVFRSLRSFRGDSAFGTWLYRIVMNLSINRARHKKMKGHRELQLVEYHTAGISADPANDPQPDLHLHIERALHRLPTLQRAVVILRHMHGLSTKQVSGILGCSEGTVKTHLFRGLKKMRTMLDFLRVDGVK